MSEIFKNPFIYIVLVCVLVFLYALISGIHKGKKGGKKGGGKTDKTSDENKGGDSKEDVTTYDEFRATPETINTSEPEADVPVFDDINNMEVPPLEEQAYDFFSDLENDNYLKNYFGTDSLDLFSSPKNEPIDYTIKEYDYNKVWEVEPEAISFDYDNYDVNYEPPKKQPRIKKYIKNLNNVQKAILFADILKRKTFKSSEK